MAGTMSVSGLISGMSTDEVISKLMEVERQPLTTLNKKKTNLNNKADAWRQLNLKLYALKDAAYALQSIDMFRSRTVNVSDQSVVTATASSGALTSNYNITVQKLAKSQSLTSDAMTSADTALNLAGTFQINGKDITITAEDTLTTLAEKINKTSDVKVMASVIKVNDNEYKLVLTSRETGVSNAIQFTDGTTEDGNSILQSLGILNSEGLVKNETQAAQDAVFTVNGLQITKSSNTVDDVIAGVTLNLKRESPGTVIELNVSEDKDKIVNATKNFVEKYNDVMKLINEYTSYSYDSESDTRTTGILFGDSTLMYIQSQLKQFLSKSISGVDKNVSLLTLVGISTGSGVEAAKTGLLEFDETTFRNKLDSNFEDIGKMFGSIGSSDGLFTQMNDLLNEMTRTKGLISIRTDSIQSEIKVINESIEALEERLEKREKAYYSQFSAMEQALARLQTQASYISAFFASSSS
ncbi:MAG TPA: flagellar filament capping protein FliD [Bacillota bacterium]|nr:flagellar filament capping protein FliD [Bacillota bacterium]